MRRSLLPSAGLVLRVVFPTVDRLGDYPEYSRTASGERMGYVPKLLTMGYLMVAAGLVAPG